MLEAVGSPHVGQKFILVTGSKGKGSTSRFISSLLSHMGYKVGLFTSPHLFHFNERIRIDGKAISEEDFARWMGVIKPAFEQIERELPPHVYQGPVGVALTAATLFFKENKTDINVIECGRGGRYDDANVLDNEWAVITPIFEEHVNNLGPTVQEITQHKLGIVKEHTKYTYIGSQRPEVLSDMKSSLNGSGAQEVSFYSEQFWAEEIRTTTQGMEFSVRTMQGYYPRIHTRLLGEYQAVNAALAIQLCEDLNGKPLDPSIVRTCFSHIQWPGRCEIVSENPTIILDGAIHQDSAKYLATIVKGLVRNTTGKKITAIIGVPADKDYVGVIGAISEISDQIIVTQPDISHLKFPKDALQAAERFKEGSLEFPYLKDALDYAAEKDPTGIILVVGTQIFLGNAKRLLGQSLMDIGK